MRCLACGSTVATDAAVCEHCGLQLGSIDRWGLPLAAPRRRRIWLIPVALVALAAGLWLAARHLTWQQSTIDRGSELRSTTLAMPELESPEPFEAAAALRPARFKPLSSGRIRDLESGALWAERGLPAYEPGDAVAACHRLGMAVPGLEELTALMLESERTPCGADQCRIHRLFRLTGPLVWSSSPTRPLVNFAVEIPPGANYLPSERSVLCIDRSASKV